MTEHGGGLQSSAKATVGTFFPRVPGSGVFFTRTEQDEIDNIDWEQSGRRIFAGALILKAKLPLMGTPTDADFVAQAMELAFATDDAIEALRKNYRLHDNKEYIREAAGFA